MDPLIRRLEEIRDGILGVDPHCGEDVRDLLLELAVATIEVATELRRTQHLNATI